MTNALVLFATSLSPFPTAVIAATLAAGNLDDERTGVVVYAPIGVALGASRLVFSRHPSGHPEPTEAGVATASSRPSGSGP